eukprot:CAMPEP_0119115922 /NCGR_PEP_ID=MMETSP1180-20130426/52009_1 /TAXON_ID=3052 ORGANISM="Chlamydomonas cf sp, Strain CCMP681" /NCGR_SAMPLE_ID=MMETSP1180 /ASSEMBLY_ACC=CAM_ASM_000741 /LENGTH=356 /DNA_ID=CAMNT_0007105029 /DNA_START=158 /DNA_END=1228 /DNA_ORIENTATION=+
MPSQALARFGEVMAQLAAAMGLHHSVAPQVLGSSTVPGVLANLDCILFDCDGVLWKGGDVIPGAGAALQALRAEGKRILFISNNTEKSRAEYVSKFKSMGLEVEASEVVSASYAAAAYFDSLPDWKASGKKVLVLANKGVTEELDDMGIEWIGGEDWAPPILNGAEDLSHVTLNSDIGAVLVGWDPAFNYSRLAYAAACIRELPGCLFIGTNMDHCDRLQAPNNQPWAGAALPGKPDVVQKPGPQPPRATSRMMPGNGCLVMSVAAAAGREPVVVGKGGPWLLPFLSKRYDLQPSRTAIVGDRLDTDVALGIEGGLKTLLPLTGVTTKEQAMTAGAAGPNYVIESVAVLAGVPVAV